MAIDIPAKGVQTASPFGTPDTPPPPYDIKQGWMTGIFGCLRPVLSIIGKGGHEIRNEQGEGVDNFMLGKEGLILMKVVVWLCAEYFAV